MNNTLSHNLDKIVNPELAHVMLRGIEPHGEFKAFVRFADDASHPDYMQVMELHSPGLFQVRIACDQMENLADDSNVLSVELREHISTGRLR